MSIDFMMAGNPSTYRGPPAGVSLTARPENFLVARSGRIVPAAGHFEVLFTLRRLASVEGQVVDQQGRSVADATVFHTGNAAPRIETKTDSRGHFQLAGLAAGKPPLFVAHPAYRFHGQLVNTSAKPRELIVKLVAIDQMPPPLRTLPPATSHEEELKTARQIIRPLWEAAMKSAEDGAKESCCEMYVAVDPWTACDYVDAHLSKNSRSRFVMWEMPLLHSADFEEALAVLESLDMTGDLKAFALLRTVREVPNLNPQQQLQLLDRATHHLRATTDPGERVQRLSEVAVKLFELDKVEEAGRIVDLLTPTAKQLSPKTNPAACAAAGEAISLFDLPAGLQMIRATREADRDYYWLPALFHVVYRIAKQQPDEAERIACEAIDYAVRSSAASHRKEFKSDPTEKELANLFTWHQIRLVPLCHRLVLVDGTRAQRTAASIRNPFVRAYAVGMMAKALAPSDRARSRTLILQAYGTLSEACREPGHRWPRECWLASPPIIAAGLLPVVEQIDPTLANECLWRAVSFRLHRMPDDCLVSLEPEFNDAALADFLARYDRDLARALLPQVQIMVSPAHDTRSEDYFCTMARTMIDGLEALENLRTAAAAPGADAGQVFFRAGTLMELLAIDGAHRWDAVASRHSLWIPNNQYPDIHGFSW